MYPAPCSNRWMPAFTPREIHLIFEHAFNSGDVEGILSLYEPGAVFVFGGEPITGTDAYAMPTAPFSPLVRA